MHTLLILLNEPLNTLYMYKQIKNDTLIKLNIRICKFCYHLLREEMEEIILWKEGKGEKGRTVERHNQNKQVKKEVHYTLY